MPLKLLNSINLKKIEMVSIFYFFFTPFKKKKKTIFWKVSQISDWGESGNCCWNGAIQFIEIQIPFTSFFFFERSKTKNQKIRCHLCMTYKSFNFERELKIWTGIVPFNLLNERLLFLKKRKLKNIYEMLNE